MIGQKTMQTRMVHAQPRFTILVGAKGSGRKTLVNEKVVPKFTFSYTCGVSIDNVRTMIDTAKYNAGVKSLYFIPDADAMSLNAKNALLKLLEEPPRDAYFIMTLENEENTLPTIRSRATIYYMDRYSSLDLTCYMREKWGIQDDKMQQLLVRLCSVPGEIDLLANMVTEFDEYVEKVVNNIAVVSGSNSFKIGAKINLDGDDSKFDLGLFWRGFINACMSRIKLGKEYARSNRKYTTGIQITSKYIQSLRVNGVNKQMAFDNWLLDIRAEWFNYADD